MTLRAQAARHWRHTVTFAVLATLPFPTLPQEASLPAGEPELWCRIANLRGLPSAVQVTDNWFVAAAERRRALLASLRLYETLYPGGAHRDEAIRLELTSLFELGTLHGGDLALLRERVDEILHVPPSEAALHEAAYWSMFCRASPGMPAVTSQPTSGTLVDPDALRRFRAYCSKYPHSVYSPRLAALVFADAVRRGDRGDMERVTQRLAQDFPRHAITEQLAAACRRTPLMEVPWNAEPLLGICAQDAQPCRGVPLLIVVWAARDEASCRCALEIERFRRDHPELRVFGIGLDESAAQTAARAHELGLDWPQCNDGLGWGGTFVRYWGIDRIPLVLVVNRAGFLVGSGGADSWRPLVARALEPAN